ncbi:hypothetical protein BJF85_14275 [Saccharomonospora sp. CUA-673]|nr:hypothetical protein BJF85_14275 [Saccharomonospora sp. CUA-673]
MIVFVTVGGSLLVFAALGAMMVYFHKRHKRTEADIQQRLGVEAQRRGWNLIGGSEEILRFYNFVYDTYSTGGHPLNPLQRRARAVAVKDVITGVHRGRSFIAGTFDVVTPKRERVKNMCVWVTAPGAVSTFALRKSDRISSTVNRGLGWYNFRSGRPEIDNHFAIRADDQNFAAQFVNDSIVHYLGSYSGRLDGVIVRGDQIEVWDDCKDHRDPDQLIAALDVRCDLLDRVPEAAWAAARR